jgi:hypothetical protein
MGVMSATMRRSSVALAAGMAVAVLAGLGASSLTSSAAAASMAPPSRHAPGRLPQIVLPPLPPLPPISLPPIDVPPIEIAGLPVDLAPITLPPVDPPTSGAPASTPPSTDTSSTLLGPIAALLGGESDPGLAGADAVPPVVPMAQGVLAAVVADARVAIRALADAGVAPEMLVSLDTLVTRLVTSSVAITDARVRELQSLVAHLRASLPFAVQPLLAPVQELVDQLLGSIVGGVVVLPVTTPGVTSSTDLRSKPFAEPTGDAPRRDRRPFDALPVGSDTALFGASLILPAPLPTPTRDPAPLAITGALAGASVANTDRSHLDAVLPSDSIARTPVEPRAPPSDERILRALGCGPEARPG